jgi:hypothetical protein
MMPALGCIGNHYNIVIFLFQDDDDAQWSLLYIVCVSGHSTHFQVGGDNPKVEGGIMQNQYAKQRLKPVFYFYFDIFIFEKHMTHNVVSSDHPLCKGE